MITYGKSKAIFGKQTAEKTEAKCFVFVMARYASGKPLAELALASLGEMLSPKTLLTNYGGIKYRRDKEQTESNKTFFLLVQSIRKREKPARL